MNRLLFIVMLLGACDSSSSKIRLTSPGSSADSGGVPDRDVIVVKPAGSKTIDIDVASAPPGNLDGEDVAAPPPPPPPPPPPAVTVRDIDAKLPKDAAWVAASGGSIPPDALAGGTYNDGLLFICRVKNGDAYLPGQVVGTSCTVADGGLAIGYPNYEVLTYLPDDVSLAFRTTATTVGAIPANSMGMGLKAGKIQYVCLVTVGANRYVGRSDTAGTGCHYMDIPTSQAMTSTSYSMVVTVP